MFYDNFIKLCNSIGKSPSSVAKDIGIEKSTVSRWKKGATPTDATVEKVASYFGISSAAVIGAAAFGGIPGLIAGAATGAIVSGAMASGPKHKITVSESDTSLLKGVEHIDLGTFHRIPILGRISAGLPLYAEQHIEGYTVTDLNGQAEYFALIVHGDSMNALGINDGYRIIVRRQDEVENGQVAVVMVGDEDATVKRFYASGGTITLMPQSTNPEHQPQIYDPAKTPVTVIGRVVRVEHDL